MNIETMASYICKPSLEVILSGVAKLGHTGARALATKGCAPPMQALLKIIGAECTIINRELGAKSAQRCWNRAAQCCYFYLQNNDVSYALLISMYACFYSGERLSSPRSMLPYIILLNIHKG